MVNQLIEMYRDGAITGYQVMMECLQILDPSRPGLVLSKLPQEIIDEMYEYIRRYDPSCMRSGAGLPPALDQVNAAQKWIEVNMQYNVGGRGLGAVSAPVNSVEHHITGANRPRD